MTNNNKNFIIKTYIGLVVAVLIIGGLIWLANKDKNKVLNDPTSGAPAVLIADEVNSIDTDCVNNYSIAFNNKSLNLLGDNKLIRYDDKLGGDSGGSFNDNQQRRCIAFDDVGGLYMGGNNIEVITGEPDFASISLKCPTDAIITSIAISEDFIYAADAGHRCILRFKRDGLSNETKPEMFQKDFDIKSPYFDLAFANDKLFAADPGRHKIKVFDEMGCELSSWGRGANCDEGFFGCCNPANFALLSDGSFVTIEKGKVRVKLYSPEGNYIGMIADPELFKDHRLAIQTKDTAANHIALDVAVDKADNIYIMEPLTGKIRIFKLKNGQ
ncbi:MAG: hypothetical protein JEZ07_05800 [Phycisphaerae bacterium]|nr:hypothetical protein [Phycisphaerae bacterium]